MIGRPFNPRTCFGEIFGYNRRCCSILYRRSLPSHCRGWGWVWRRQVSARPNGQLDQAAVFPGFNETRLFWYWTGLPKPRYRLEQTRKLLPYRASALPSSLMATPLGPCDESGVAATRRLPDPTGRCISRHCDHEVQPRAQHGSRRSGPDRSQYNRASVTFLSASSRLLRRFCKSQRKEILHGFDTKPKELAPRSISSQLEV